MTAVCHYLAGAEAVLLLLHQPAQSSLVVAPEGEHLARRVRGKSWSGLLVKMLKIRIGEVWHALTETD